ncbi:unnamed protein product [Rhizoctonia solani]|uniref:Uncharacterized protein n=1 Tax=Rhizoctonia solani TaxID=456999 RepID=A0A8H2XNZ4_9AGAM|nr:unnamed protein product [Rhizoctonia solani]
MTAETRMRADTGTTRHVSPSVPQYLGLFTGYKARVTRRIGNINLPLALQPLSDLAIFHPTQRLVTFIRAMYPYGPFRLFNSAPHPAPQPGPTHIYYNRGPKCMCRGPRCLFWFGLGGLATYWFIQTRERKHQIIIKRTEDCHVARSWGHWGDPRREMEAQQWIEENRRKCQEDLRQFRAKIADMADSSLDSVLNSVLALKAKIAEQRAASQAARASSPKA